MLVCCDDCWVCCAPCGMSCDHEDKTERVRHPDASWMCNRLIKHIDYRDAVLHALTELEHRMIKDCDQAPEGFKFVREMIEEIKWNENNGMDL